MTKRRQFNKGERRAVLRKTGGHCAYCGKPIGYYDMQVDHVIPLRKGGTNDLDNLVPACRSCNHYKSTLTVNQFRESLGQIPGVLTRDSASYRIAKEYGIIKEEPGKIVFYFEKPHDEEEEEEEAAEEEE